MAVVTAALRPAAVCITTESVVPTGASGHAKLTKVGEASTTAAGVPFTSTCVPPIGRLSPHGYAAVPFESQPPRTVASPPREHTASLDPLAAFSKLSTTGVPSPACTATTAVLQVWVISLAEKVTRSEPGALGVHSNSPVEESKRAPNGSAWAATVTAPAPEPAST
jgi:hypothetical protein